MRRTKLNIQILENKLKDFAYIFFNERQTLKGTV